MPASVTLGTIPLRNPDGSHTATSGLVYQLAAQVYFLATALEVFGMLESHADIDRLRGRSTPPLLDGLAEARRNALLGPGASWSATNLFRGSWGLTAHDRPWQSAIALRTG